MLPLRRLLDPRPEAEARRDPIADAANIPFEELALRTHELPPSGQTIFIAAEPDLTARTGEWLRRGGRTWQAASFERAETYSPGRLWQPNPLVAGIAEAVPPGVAWDLGCGTGRDAIFLASAGWNVVAIDHLEDALARGAYSAERLLGPDSSRIRWAAVDVADASPPAGIALLLMILFFDQDALLRGAEALPLGGTVVLEVFTPTNRAEKGKPKDPALTLDTAQCRRLLDGFDFRLCEEGWDGERHKLRVWATKIR